MKTSTFEGNYIADASPARSGLIDAVSGVFASIRKAAADRALHRQLADMDDNLLRDIGLADDEIYRIRQGANVTTHNWR